MKNDKRKGSKGGAMSAPLDSSRSGEDFIGDTTGLTGITTGSAYKTSATPNDIAKDENKDHLPGGIITTPKQTQETGGRLPNEINTTEEYDRHTLQNMSPTKAAEANDLATETDTTPSPRDDMVFPKPFDQGDRAGEQSVSGSTSEPSADDDTLEAAHDAGTQLQEDEEHPQDVDIARDIDKAEEDLRTH